jgi:hypothetical protein
MLIGSKFALWHALITNEAPPQTDEMYFR